MKTKPLIITLFSLSTFFMNAQSTIYNKPLKSINKTKVELLYSHYIQDGNHSAITGGIGTEELTVYAPKAKITNTFKTRNTLSLEAGVDIITSASTDKIDFVVSSASMVDARNYANIAYSRQLKNKPIQLNIGTGYSFESDYLSFPLNIGIKTKEKNNLRTYSFKIQTFFDDLRWGRLHPDYRRPAFLIYPQELRNIKWFDVYRRTSYNFKFGFTQVLNKRNILGIYPELGYQQGLLSTPFHRVYFKNQRLQVENLPQHRFRKSLTIKLNSFLGDRFIFKNEFHLYKDDFGISAFSFSNTSIIKFNKPISIASFFRFFTQKGSPFFAPFKQHDKQEEYYTSDFDLSNFQSYKIGLNLRFAPQEKIKKHYLFDEMQIRYAYLYRIDGLKAHIVSASFSLTSFKKQGDG